MGTEISAYVREMHFLNLLYTRQEVLHSEVGLEITAALKNKFKKKVKEILMRGISSVTVNLKYNRTKQTCSALAVNTPQI